MGIHSWRNNHRSLSRQKRRSECVISQAVRHFRYRVGGGRGNDDRIGPFGKGDVINAQLRLRIEHVGDHRPMGDRGKD